MLDVYHDMTWSSQVPYKLKQISMREYTDYTKSESVIEGVTNRAFDLPENAQKNGLWTRLTYGNQKWSKLIRIISISITWF